MPLHGPPAPRCRLRPVGVPHGVATGSIRFSRP